jgi:hypothetical protein
MPFQTTEKFPDYDPIAVSKQLDNEDKGRLKKALTKAKILKLVMIHRRAKRENYADKVYNQIKELLKEV